MEFKTENLLVSWERHLAGGNLTRSPYQNYFADYIWLREKANKQRRRT